MSYGGENMKKMSKILNKIIPAFVTCLTLVLTVSANSSSCFFLHQDEEPKAIAKFKKIK